MKKIKGYIKSILIYFNLYNFYYDIKLYFENRALLKKWVNEGKPDPIPHIIKQNYVKEYAKKCKSKILVETGTFGGHMIYTQRKRFDRIYSVELSQHLYEKAKKKFHNFNHIYLLKGDSGKVLPNILNELSENTIFWLDGHYSGGKTAKGNKETPILEELVAILNSKNLNYCVLIDDARCFNGRNDYPTIKFLENLVLSNNPNLKFEVSDDIIQIF